jgi:hypothetical protein
MDGYHHDTRHGENDGDVEIYVGIIHAENLSEIAVNEERGTAQ